MLLCPVYIETDPCRFSNFLSGLTPIPSLLPNSFQLNLFADPHPLNLYATIFYKNIRGRWYSRRSPSPKSFPCHTSENSPVSPIIATLPKTSVSNPCVCHTSETPRGILPRRESQNLPLFHWPELANPPGRISPCFPFNFQSKIPTRSGLSTINLLCAALPRLTVHGSRETG